MSGEWFRILFENSPVGIALVSPEGRPVQANPRLAEMLGYEPAELEGMTFPEFTHPDDVDKDLSLYQKLVEGRIEKYQITKRYLARDGSVVWGDLRVTTVKLPGEEETHQLAFVRDVTEERERQRELHRSERRYRTLFEHNVAGAFRSTPEGTILECNEALAELLGYDSPRELQGRDAGLLFPPREDRRAYIGRLREQGRVVNEELRLQRRDGSRIWVLENSVLTEDPATGEVVIQGTLVDVTERKRLEEQLRHRALHDPLTGLANRTLLSDRVEQGLARAARRGGLLGLLMLDVDRFKRINDSLGHTAGDRVLEEMARRLKRVVREEDTVARWGGDEFVVVLPELEEAEAISAVVERIRSAVRRPIEAGGESLRLDVSVGAVVRGEGDDVGWTVPTRDGEELMRYGDQALHRSKEQSARGFYLFEGEEPGEEGGRIRLEQELRKGLDGRRIVPYYQPVVRLEDGSTESAEALARWRHPDRGLLPPAEFLTVAEMHGLLHDVGSEVIRQGAADASAWPDREGAGPIPVRFNLTGDQLEDPALARKLEGWLEAAGLPAGRVAVEVTETSLMRATARIEDLHAVGVEVYIDDFGTGYSTFTYLRDLDVEGFKIDKGFVQGITRSQADVALVEAMLTLGEELGLTVVAEGIETEGQRRKLRELGCQLGQGFLFAEPMPAGRFGELLSGPG